MPTAACSLAAAKCPAAKLSGFSGFGGVANDVYFEDPGITIGGQPTWPNQAKTAYIYWCAQGGATPLHWRLGRGQASSSSADCPFSIAFASPTTDFFTATWKEFVNPAWVDVPGAKVVCCMPFVMLCTPLSFAA